MAIEIDKSKASTLLQKVRKDCLESAVNDCPIASTIDFLLSAKNSLTYRYIMFTALVAKATCGEADILSLQASDDAEGAYDARSLCSKVVYPFQKMFLGDTVDGSNNDPLVNKPGRYPRLDPTNKAQGGDPTKSLELLCRDLPSIKTSHDAEICLSYLISRLIERQELELEKAREFAEVAQNSDEKFTRSLINELIDQGFGGAAITIAATAMLRVAFPLADGFESTPHPMNQAGSSSKQYSDLDVTRFGKPWLGVELKDKPFTSIDVERAAKTAKGAGARAMLFIGGRASTINDQTSAYFVEARDKWMEKGIYLGLMSIDALVDFTFAAHEIDTHIMLNDLKLAAERIKSIEAQMWIYAKLEELKKES